MSLSCLRWPLSILHDDICHHILLKCLVLRSLMTASLQNPVGDLFFKKKETVFTKAFWCINIVLLKISTSLFPWQLRFLFSIASDITEHFHLLVKSNHSGPARLKARQRFPSQQCHLLCKLSPRYHRPQMSSLDIRDMASIWIEFETHFVNGI